MQDALGVRRFERVGHLRRDAQRFVERQRTVQGRAVDVLHDEVVGPDVVQHADVRMVQRRDGPRLLLEALAVSAVESS